MSVLESANNVTAITYAATYVLYGITLAFSLYLANQEVSDARETVEREAGSLEGLADIACQLPRPEREQMRNLAESYARVVIEEEWPLMEQGAKSHESPRTQNLMDELQASFLSFAPETSAEQALYSQGITLISDMEEDRAVRWLHSRQDSHALLWYVLVAGGVITVLHSFFFGTRVVWLQALSVAALTTVIVLVLSTIYQLQAPFAGTVRVEPAAFEEVLSKIRE